MHQSERASPAPVRGWPQLPLTMADFARRGFRLDRPSARATLERHGRSFLGGFNLAVSRWRAPHAALQAVEPEERGFAYEGAGMFAGLLDALTGGQAKALNRLLGGPGDEYVHLVHVGAGWLFTAVRIPAVVRLPESATPLLRWLADDGSGFGEVYFGGLRTLQRRARKAPVPRWEVRLAGCGRALWFAQSADPDGVAGVIAGVPGAARPHLWSGVGLAAAYAGGVDDNERKRLAELAGRHRQHLEQGVVFAAAARVRAGIVPEHTERACAQLLGTTSKQAAGWTEVTSADLRDRRDVRAYLEWKARLRGVLAGRS